jgi:two-component system nitrate/nitrite response regulator NarL
MRIWVCPLPHELLLCETLGAAFRLAQHEVVNDLHPDNPPDIVIVTVSSLRESCRLIANIADQHSSVSVVALGERCNEEAVVELIEAGAKAFVDRGQSVVQLLFTLDAVMQQRAPASGRVTAQVIRKIQNLNESESPSGWIWSLTRREQVVLDLVARGYSNKQIAASLSISSNTVRNHIHRILDKLQVGRRRDAARLALSPHFPATRERPAVAAMSGSA